MHLSRDLIVCQASLTHDDPCRPGRFAWLFGQDSGAHREVEREVARLKELSSEQVKGEDAKYKNTSSRGLLLNRLQVRDRVVVG